MLATASAQVCVPLGHSSLYLLACTPTFGKVGYNFFSLAPLANPVLYPHLKIRGAAHGSISYCFKDKPAISVANGQPLFNFHADWVSIGIIV